MNFRLMTRHRSSRRVQRARRKVWRKLRPLCRFGSGTFAVVLIISGLQVVANADDISSNIGSEYRFTKRPYVAAGAGLTHLKPRSPNSALTIEDDRDAGAHLAIGYDFSRLLSAELYAASLGSASVGFLGAPVGDVDYQVFGISAIAYLLNTQSGTFLNRSNGRGDARRTGMSLYGRFGVGGLGNSSDVAYRRDHSSHAVFGVGLEYGFENGFAVRGEYMSMDTDAQYVTASLVKRFGRTPAVPTAKTADKNDPPADDASTGIDIEPFL